MNDPPLNSATRNVQRNANANAPFFASPGAAGRWGGEPPPLLAPDEQGPSIIAAPPLGDLLLLPLPLPLLPLWPTARGEGRALGGCVGEDGLIKSSEAGPWT